MLATRSMRRLSVVLSLLLATQAVAAPTAPQRSWLSGVGVGLVGLGLGLAGFGVSQQLIATDARAIVTAYGIPSVSEAPAVALMEKRASTASNFALGGFIGGGVLLAGGIVLLLLDKPAASPVTAWVVPLTNGAAAGLTATW